MIPPGPAFAGIGYSRSLPSGLSQGRHATKRLTASGSFRPGPSMKMIPPTQGKEALVDDEDYEYLKDHSWVLEKDHKTSYAGIYPSVSGKRIHIPMHHVIMGKPEAGFQIDHIDGNGLNNQKSNLRVVTHRQNCQNRHQVKASKFPGVDFCKKRGLWRARILLNKKRLHLGRFTTEIEAYSAYKLALKQIGAGVLESA